MANQTNILAFLGSYADSANPGIYACRFDTENGSLTLLDEASGLQNPTFLAVDTEKSRLYALTEGTGSEGQRCGAAAAYSFDPASGRLTLLGQEITVPATTCHITLDRTGQTAMVASYHGGMLGLSPVLEDGRLGETADIRQHHGSSVLPVQDRPRAHSVTIDAANRYAVACDLGLDRIFVYRLDVPGRRLVPHRETVIPPGSGPRHFAFHPALPYAYVINELSSTVTVLAYDAELGELTVIETVSTLPEGFAGESATADIHLSPDGRFLYGSNRGHDSIVVYSVDAATGRLTAIQHEPTLGEHPRNFALSPDGRFLLCANKDTNNIVTFARDAETGRLTPNGQVLQLSKPVCVKFAVIG